MKNFTEKNEKDLPLYPGLLPYGHTVGAPAFRPNNEAEIKNSSQRSMIQQVNMQRDQIIEQLRLLEKQYKELDDRQMISNLIYSVDMRFKPVPGEVYFLYFRQSEKNYFISLIEPDYWGKAKPPTYVAKITLLYDLTWKVLDKSNFFEDFKSGFQ